MTRIAVIDVVERAVLDLSELGFRFALVGGLATSLRGEPRTTRDVDLAVAVRDDREAERLVRDLVARRYRVLLVLEHDVTKRLATVRLMSPVDGITVLDLLFGSCGIEPEIVAEATPVSLGAVVVPVARAAHLVAMKLLARDDATRPQDGIDLAALRGKLDEREIDAARAACRLIEGRGTHRDKPLAELFEQWCSPGR